MKKETVTLKNAKRDICRGVSQLKTILTRRLAYFFALTSLLAVVGYSLWSMATNPAVKKAVLVPTLILTAVSAFFLVCILINAIDTLRRTSDFKVAKTRLESSETFEEENADFDIHHVHPAAETVAYFEAGRWSVPFTCFVWSKEHWISGESLLSKYRNGSEFYVLYGKDKTVYYAYPADLFELSEEVSNFERLREEKKEKRRRY